MAEKDGERKADTSDAQGMKMGQAASLGSKIRGTPTKEQKENVDEVSPVLSRTPDASASLSAKLSGMVLAEKLVHAEGKCDPPVDKSAQWGEWLRASPGQNSFGKGGGFGGAASSSYSGDSSRTGGSDPTRFPTIRIRDLPIKCNLHSELSQAVYSHIGEAVRRDKTEVNSPARGSRRSSDAGSRDLRHALEKRRELDLRRDLINRKVGITENMDGKEEHPKENPMDYDDYQRSREATTQESGQGHTPYIYSFRRVRDRSALSIEISPAGYDRKAIGITQPASFCQRSRRKVDRLITMDVSAVASPNLYFLDLVSSGPMLIDRGLVLPDGEVDNIYLPIDTFKLMRIDDSVVYKNVEEIKVVDRSHLYPGQVVGAASDMGGQIGVVTGVNTVLNLAKLDNNGLPTKVIRGVSPSSLRRIRCLNLGDFVVSGPWLGRVVEVSIDIDVLFDDGAVCRVTDAESKNLLVVCQNINTMRRRQMNSIFHQGQCVGGPDACSIFKAARWLNGYWHPERELGTIMKLETSGVLVYWVASIYCGTNRELVEASAPPAYQNPDDLTFFCASHNCCWGLADRCFFLEASSTSNEGGAACSPDQDDDEEEEDDEDEEEEEEVKDEYNACSQDNQEECEASTSQVVPPTKQNDARFYRKQLRKFVFEGHRRAQRSQVMRHVEVEFPMLVANTCTTVDVLWQDGTRQHGRPSATIAPFGILNEQEFFPGQHVVANVLPINATVDATDDHDEVTTTSANKDIDAPGPTERVGIVKSLKYEDQTVCVSWFKTPEHPDDGREVECDDTVSAYDLKLHSNHSAYYGDIVIRILPSGSKDDSKSVPLLPGNKKKNIVPADLSWVGRVVELPNGNIQVKWGDGSMSTVLPHEIVVVKDEQYMELWLEMGDWVEDDGSDDAREEPVAANTDIDHQNLDNDVENNSPAMSRTKLSFRSLLQLTSDVVARGKGYWMNWRSPSSLLPNSGLHTPTNDESIGDAAVDVTSHGFAGGTKAADATCCCDESFCPPRFDVLQISPLDHHYLDTTDQVASRAKSWAKTVQKEWKILENDLPETIYVRAFEDRMDLLRVMMVGASGTPYHHGLFFFDLQLPPSYPSAPPQVYYHSFGLRLNPNLYESGTVCLSLLNTFGGEGTEVWSSTASSLLQVVVSIQGLVLNDKPYYNEAGYETLVDKPEGCRNALSYNENAYLLTLRTMQYLLRRPPQGFEEFVKEHFRRRGRFVLKTCNALLQGNIVDNAHATEAGRRRPCSAGLRLALANVVPSLVSAFTQIRAEGC
ncbi:putative ubiquitin carrier protein E2 23 [Hordeum vulgare]|nr:putative ubiquitin carrier protein E2 23 [Hordeum vulgare]